MDREEKRIDITIEAVKQQITISVAVIAFVAALAGKESPILVSFATLSFPFLISIAAGILALLSIPFPLWGPDDDPFKSPIVRLFGIVQALFFFAGLVTLVALAA